ATEAAGQKSTLVQDVELCNSEPPTPPDSRIAGCSSLIKTHSSSPRVAVIAYNNRGVALASKGEYDQAIQDYDSAIKIDAGDPKVFNNRGVAYQKKGDHG